MKPNPDITTRTNEISAAFQAVQNGIKGDALSMKLKMFFAGLLVNELREIHFEMFGETRGRPSEEERGKSISTISVNDWLESHLGVTARTCRNYFNLWLSITQSTLHADAVQRLNNWWTDHRPSLQTLTESVEKAGKGKPKADSKSLTPTHAAFGTLAAAGIIAGDLTALLEEADTLGLHELFERPTKDVTPEEVTKHQDKSQDRQLELALSYWGPQGQVIKAINRKAYLHLPKAEREALANTLQEALEEINQTLRRR